MGNSNSGTKYVISEEELKTLKKVIEDVKELDIYKEYQESVNKNAA